MNNNLYVSPDSPWIIHAAAMAVLVAHITGGGVGLLSGAVALTTRKGGALHRMAGTIFFVSMLIAAGVGACVSPFQPRPALSNMAMGMFVCYLVATSWMTVRRREGSVGRFEIVAFAVAVATLLLAVMLKLRGPDPTDTTGGAGLLVFGPIAALAAAGDLRMIIRGGVVGVQRIARHLWRMCLALLIAAISIFLGQPQLYSPSVHKSGVLFAPELAVRGLLIFWLVRVRFTNGFR
jgi:uncharacterized membrane protein